MAGESTGFGSSFKMGDPLLELSNIVSWPDLPSYTRDLIDTTNYKSTGGFKTYRSSPLKEGDEASLVMDIVLGSPADAACRAAMADGKAQPFQMLLPTDDTDPEADMYEFSGFLIVRTYKRTNPMDDVRKATLTVKWTGAPTEGVAA